MGGHVTVIKGQGWTDVQQVLNVLFVYETSGWHGCGWRQVITSQSQSGLAVCDYVCKLNFGL